MSTAETRINHWSPDGEAPEWLYRFDQTVPKLDGWDAVTDEALEQFATQGFLAVDHAFTAAEIDAAIAGLMDCLAGRKKGFDLNVEAAVKDWDKVRHPQARLKRVRKLNAFVDSEPRLKYLCEHPRLLDVLTRLMGEPPALYANQALLKPPFIGSEKPWHQDMAYFNFAPHVLVIGAWIALDEARPDNGCMHVIPGSHLAGPELHFKVRDWQICDTAVACAEDRYVPLAPGGLLLFHGLVHHGTAPNRSAHTRRALQFHYNPASVSKITPEQRLEIWGAEGKDVEC